MGQQKAHSGFLAGRRGRQSTRFPGQTHETPTGQKGSGLRVEKKPLLFLAPCFNRLLSPGIVLWFLFSLAGKAIGQPVPDPSAASILNRMHHLQHLGRVLYVGAHPDDENTALLSWLVNERHVEAAYLSLTRGEGGQNRIGSERGTLLGVLRTQELLAARRLDGAAQFFSRAIDFGYTKSRQEALERWGEAEIVRDLVWLIRWYQPDLIITRFSPQVGGHGQHLASAYLAQEAARLAADPSYLPALAPWQVKHLIWNAWPGAYRKQAPPGMFADSISVAALHPLLGLSHVELAARSRSMHRSQAFGQSPVRGARTEYFLSLDGRPLPDSLFWKAFPAWEDLPGGHHIRRQVNQLISSFQPEAPYRSVPGLLRLHQQLKAMPPDRRVASRMKMVEHLIRDCLALWLEATLPGKLLAPGDSVTIRVAAVNRSPLPLRWMDLQLPELSVTRTVQQTLVPFHRTEQNIAVQLPDTLPVTIPYWLRANRNLSGSQSDGSGAARYNYPSKWLAYPENPSALQCRFQIQLGDTALTFTVPVQYRWTDPLYGEKWRNGVVAPPLTIQQDLPVILFPTDSARSVRIRVQKHTSRPISATLQVNLPPGWQGTTSRLPLHFSAGQQEQEFTMLVKPPAAEEVGLWQPEISLAGQSISFTAYNIDYPHIVPQWVFLPARWRLVRLAIQIAVRRIGYIMGSGDEIPWFLKELGYQVTLLSDRELREGNLQGYDAIIAGIRAYNVRPVLRAAYRHLMEYVQRGGTLIVQYNTAHRLVTDSIGPYPFRISRLRVTREEAPVQFLNPNHPALRWPNPISTTDFEHWVQERGLYFADQWDPRYQTPLASADPGEKPLPGGVLVGQYGKGWFVYTGLSFFRQLPAGVTGAYRLLVNLIALSKNPLNADEERTK